MSLSKTPEYEAWDNMLRRCLSKNYPRYFDYGGRGITVCKEWVNSFPTFLSDLGYRPSKEYSLEKRDNSKGYSKDNCYWATKLVQGCRYHEENI